MKKYIFLALIFTVILIIPVGLNAAYNDVTLTTDTVLTVNGVNLDVSGSNTVVESITVGSSNFSVTLLPSSSVTIVSTDRKTLAASVDNSDFVRNTCTATQSSIILTADPDVATATITITPSSSACSTAAATTSGGGGGGGGGSSVTVAPGVVTVPSRLQIVHPDGTIEYLDEGATTQTTTTIVQAETTTTTASASVGISSTFTKTLKKSTSNSDIKRLQQLLNSDPDTAVATSGVGSVGNETNFFGSLTQKAVQKFQLKHGVVSNSSDAGYGLVGPKTRAKLSEVFGDTTTTPAAIVAQPSETAMSVSPVFSGGLSRGSSNSDIKRLQQLLNSDPDTAVSTSGVGSAGNETNFFGSLTEKAVQKFQMKHGVVSSSDDPGYGYVGPKTRAKLSEVFGQ